MPQGCRRHKKPTPPRETLEGKTAYQVAREYDVHKDVAVRWLQERDLYTPDRSDEKTSEYGQVLLEADADEVFQEAE
jgi:hypothetical protein